MTKLLETSWWKFSDHGFSVKVACGIMQQKQGRKLTECVSLQERAKMDSMKFIESGHVALEMRGSLEIMCFQWG